MLRVLHSVPGLVVGLILLVLSVSGAVLSANPALERAGISLSAPREMSVAAVAEAALSRHDEIDHIERKPSGLILVHYFDAGVAGIEQVDPATGAVLGPYQPSTTVQFITDLHRALLLGDNGRIGAGIGAGAMVILTISGAFLLAGRLGGWRAILRPIRGSRTQRLHGELARFAIIGLLLSGLTGCYMTATTFELVDDGSTTEATAPEVTTSGPAAPVGSLAALKTVDINALRELDFPYAGDPTDIYTLITADGTSYVDGANGTTLSFEPAPLAKRIYETIYMLHTGEGLWQLGLVLGLSAATVPLLAFTGTLIWWRRRAALPRIRHNAKPQAADTVILVGSEGNSTWGFAAALHAELTRHGLKVHTAPMNALARDYARAERLLVLTATYGDGAAPASAKNFLSRLTHFRGRMPVAVLGFGDRSFTHFCRFATEVEGALADKGMPALVNYCQVDRKSSQEFARWGLELGAALGLDLTLEHVAALPKTQALELIGRQLYGTDIGAPTAILRFAVPRPARTDSLWKLVFGRRLPVFEAGDLVGILPPGSTVPRFYSLASSSSDGVLEICVRLQPGGLCSSYLHGLRRGDSIEMFIRDNPTFRPVTGTAPLVLVGAGAGIGPLAGFIRRNDAGRPVHLYWGGRAPHSDFLYREELEDHLAGNRLTSLNTAFSRIPGGGYVQDRLIADQHALRDLIDRGAQILVCGGRDMAAGVSQAIEDVVGPLGLDLQMLKARGQYVEDVY
ncbi:PepSY domain-containing protein [Oryzibacter oryziterrae]|uniref:PepSY domain-containing protein n=1 Tax=Oryzibacter oryziterrae TaxID=2766474 RepID=UPI001F22A814|nr:PepSY domain-containing protein [Oryzibacter oryziterrae]